MNSVFHKIVFKIFFQQVFFKWVLLIVAVLENSPLSYLHSSSQSGSITAKALCFKFFFNCLYCFHRSYILIIHAAIFLCCLFVFFFFTFSQYSLAFLKSIVLKRIQNFSILLENDRRRVEKTFYSLTILKSVSSN